MNVWNKVFLGLIGVTSLAFFYFSARVLSLQKTFRDRIEKVAGAGGEIERLTAQKQSTLDEIAQLDGELVRLRAGRGRVWYQCQPVRDRIDTTNGTVSLLSKEPGPHVDPNGAQVFVFQDPLYDPQGKPVPGSGFYLGEFAVAKIDKNSWDLQPSKGTTEQWLAQQRVGRLAATLARIQANQPTTWTVWEVLPKESIFALTGAPAADVPTPSAKTPPPEAQPPAWPPPGGLGPQELVDYCKKVVDYHSRKVPGSENRVDYEIGFNELYRQLTARADSINRATQELKTVAEDQTEAEKVEASLAQEKAYLLVELGRHPQQQQEEQKLGRATMVQQRQEAENHWKRLDEQQRNLKADIDRTLKANRALASEIARAQLEGLRRIQEQTEKMAQVSGGR